MSKPPLPPWSERCHRYLAGAQVRPFELKGATTWEHELFELTRRRGLPILGDIALGRDTHERTTRPEATLVPIPQAWQPFGWSPTLGPLYLEPNGDNHSVVTASATLGYRWQGWLETLIFTAPLPAFPPPLTVFDPQKRDDYLTLLAAQLRLQCVEATSVDTDSIFFNETMVLLRGGKLRCADTGSFCAALHAANELGLGWYIDASAFPEGSSPLDAPPSATEEALERRTSWGVLRATVAPTSVVQEAFLLGQSVDRAVTLPTRSFRHSAFAPLQGSLRLARWAQRRRLVRSSLCFDRAGLFAWAARHGVPTSGLDELLLLESEWGGLVSVGREEPISRPYLLFGTAVYEELYQRDGGFAVHLGSAPAGADSDEASYPRKNAYPFWSWREHRLWAIGEQSEGELFYENGGALWQWPLWEGPSGLRVVAGTARAAFERLALEEWLRETGDCQPEVRILVQADREVAVKLGLSFVPEASDWALRTYENATMWVWQTIAYGPHLTELKIVSKEIGPTLDALRVVCALEPTAKVRCCSPGTQMDSAIIEAGFGSRDLDYTSFADDEQEIEPPFDHEPSEEAK